MSRARLAGGGAGPLRLENTSVGKPVASPPPERGTSLLGQIGQYLADQACSPLGGIKILKVLA